MTSVQTPQQPQCTCGVGNATYNERHDKSCPMFMTYEQYLGQRTSETPQDELNELRKTYDDLYFRGLADKIEILKQRDAALTLADELGVKVTHLEGALREAEQQRESFREFVLKWGDGGTVEKENDERRFALAREVDELQAKLREAEAKAALATELLDGNDPVEHGEYGACCAWCGAEAIETDEYNAYQERVGEWMAPFRAQWDQTHRIQKPIGPHELGPASPWLYVQEHRNDCIWLRYRALQQPKAGA